jgi:L-lactate dehydrogenase complex protein LldG
MLAAAIPSPGFTSGTRNRGKDGDDDAREDILTAIRDRRPASWERQRVPDFSRGPADLSGLFTAALARLDGQAIPVPPAGLRAWLAATFPDATQICFAVPEVTGTITPDQVPDWAAPADIDVTVVRSPLGVAETGSILLTEKELGVNTIAVLAQHLVVLPDPADLVENIHLDLIRIRLAVWGTAALNAAAGSATAVAAGTVPSTR